MKKIALATCTELPTLNAGDRSYQKALEELGLTAEPVVWDDASLDWTIYDAVVIRSTWDYVTKLGAYKNWLMHLDQLKVEVLNPSHMVLWNIDKRYLLELESKGIHIVPTDIIDKSPQPSELEELSKRISADAVIIKPSVSATAYQTYKVPVTDLHLYQDEVNEILERCCVLIQPYLKEVELKGEYSFIFFNGTFYYSLIKRPKLGDFRVQYEHGGNENMIDTYLPMYEQAKKVIDALPTTPLYARIDMIEVDGQMLLMEAELIEPDLFIDKAGEWTADQFAKATSKLLNSKEVSL